MDRPPMIMSPSNIEWATNSARRKIEEVLERANQFSTDPKKTKRFESRLCKACYYSEWMAGQALTSRDCMRCHEKQTYGSTHTDALCLPCAKESGLCKHCGADFDLKSKRKFPEPLPKNT